MPNKEYIMMPSPDPYEILMNVNHRVNVLEDALRQIQLNQLQISNMLEQQNKLIKQAQQNEIVLSDAVGHLLLKESNK